jgi:lipid-A-disaccharide synthase
MALLPGSRESEIEANLPLMLDAARRLAERLPVFVRLIRASSIPAERLEEAIARSGVPVRVSHRDRYEAIADSHLALCASGTATLEVGLLGTPLVVVYRLSRGTYLAGKALVRLPHVSLVNLVLGKEVVPELVQVRADPERAAEAAAGILGDPARVDAMRRDLSGLRARLGERGASARAAREVAAWLGDDPLVRAGIAGLRGGVA